MQRRDRRKIDFTRHAEKRLIDREITRAQVLTVLMNPDDVLQADSDDRFKCYGTPGDIPYPEEPFLVVIYEQTNIKIKVITIMWQDTGGLRASGFSRI